MATVKVKFRVSSVPGMEGTLYYHLIHQRCLRWISTDYHVFPDEWNDKKSAIIVSNRNSRQAHLQLIQSRRYCSCHLARAFLLSSANR